MPRSFTTNPVTSQSFLKGIYQNQKQVSSLSSAHNKLPQMTMQKRAITLLTSFNVVDNSKLGQKTRRYKKPYLIGFYRKRKTADIGDVIKVAVQGRPCKALVVATRKPKVQPIPRFDNNNIVLLDDNNAPLGTRIRGPIPAILRKHRAKYSKVIALASKFV
eukprot:Seg6288.2 transcript_id=Seg6288.2/GoldUCD/mRNA.D3Y31 product="39S ribosomal protein L14 mitochondrial" pseudo=true protein_id=Seg6288.2/GoldUCD/D3Y31